MEISTLDWSFIAGFFVVSLAIGLVVARQSGKSASAFFLSGRNMPWWLLGVSMVATTFSADTPNLVTDIVRKDGVAGNWVWWAFLITGMLTVFVYAKLWRRSGVLTDLEFYEMRYSGKEAAFLRGFRALYLGIAFNILIMATVCLAAIKIGGVLLGLSPGQTLLIASVVTVAYSAIGGLKGIILTDFFQFILAMIGTIWAAIVIVNLPEVGGLDSLMAHENVVDKLDFFPTDNKELLWSLLIIPLAVQWWAAYYPGAEPGGGGYIAQRMLAAKDEKHAMGATLLFNLAHYALRPWPWILIALASLIVFPDLTSLQAAFPAIDASVVNDDLAYPAMLTYLPAGLLGLVIASLIAAFMSTISTHLNWGSSYIVNDFYKRFVNPDASEKDLVLIGRISTVVLMIFAALIALLMDNAKQAFDIIVLMGAGTGLLFILRWFWWRINAYSEIAAMVISFVVAITFKFILPEGTFEGHTELILSVLITTVGWIAVTYLTPAVEHKTLIDFYKLIKPHNMGWKSVVEKGMADGEIDKEEISVGKLPMELSGMFAGVFLVYGMLFTTGFWLYGEMGNALIGLGISIVSGFILWRVWRK
jgi:SSS family transporter